MKIKNNDASECSLVKELTQQNELNSNRIDQLLQLVELKEQQISELLEDNSNLKAENAKLNEKLAY